MLGIPLGLLTANAVEWGMHKYVLHGMGKKRGTFWAFHFHEHHREVREHGYYDPNYERFPLGMHAQGKEAWALIASAVAVAPLFPVAPFCGHSLVQQPELLSGSQKKPHETSLG